MGREPSFKFSFSLPGKIWQTALDEANGIWALEVRDPATQTIAYRLIHLKSLQQDEIAQVTGADWWTVILRVFYPLLILERYNDPQNPTDKDLIVFDVEQHQVIETLPHFQFSKLVGETIFGHHPVSQTQMKSYHLNRKDILSQEKSATRVRYPMYFPPSSENLEMVNEFLQIDFSGVGCEYFETGPYIIISYYVRWDRKFKRKLLVLKGDDELYHDVQDEGLTGYASGAFFLFEDLLVFIKNGNQINGIEL